VRTGSSETFDEDQFVRDTKIVVLEILPRLSQFGICVACGFVIFSGTSLMQVPLLYVGMTNATITEGTKHIWTSPTPYILLFPLLLACIALGVSRAAVSFVEVVHTLHLEVELAQLPGQVGLNPERLKAFHKYLKQLNRGQGPGFCVCGFVVTVTKVASLGTLALTAYPLLVSWAHSFVD
jgi:hypothetical protein